MEKKTFYITTRIIVCKVLQFSSYKPSGITPTHCIDLLST